MHWLKGVALRELGKESTGFNSVKAIEEVARQVEPLARFMRDHRPDVRVLTVSKKQWIVIERADVNEAAMRGFRQQPLSYQEFALRRSDV
jgi:hypothetical protein